MRTADLYTASEVARFCQVDLKTVHNWADRGSLPHFKTPGRHLRFRRSTVVEFLEKYGYPVPAEIAAQSAPVVFAIGDRGSTSAIKRTLAKRFLTLEYPEPIDAIIAIGRKPPEAIVTEFLFNSVDTARMIERLRQAERTAHVRVIAFSIDARCEAAALQAGAAKFIRRGDWSLVGDALETLLGVA